MSSQLEEADRIAKIANELFLMKSISDPEKDKIANDLLMLSHRLKSDIDKTIDGIIAELTNEQA